MELQPTSTLLSSNPLVDIFGEDAGSPNLPKVQHDFYFETPKNIPFRKSNEQVATEGILSKKWPSDSLHRLEIGECGAYFAWSLRDRPHCQQPRSQRRFIAKCASDRGIHDLRSFPYATPKQIDVGNLVVFNGHSPEFQDAVRQHLPGLAIEEKKSEFQQMQRFNSLPSERGNKTIYAGFAAQNQKMDTDYGVTVPQMVSSTTSLEVQRMIAMTGMMRALSKSAGFECPFSNNPTRSARFSQYLVDHFGLVGENLIEHKTSALTSAARHSAAGNDQDFNVGAHLDKLNCPLPNWNIVFTLYYHYFDPEEHRWFRVSEIAVSRACANHFLVRLNAADFLFANLVKYYNSPNNTGRRDRDINNPLDLLPSPAESDEGNVKHQHTLPIFDKALGLLSAFATIVYRASKKRNATLEKIAEIALPIMWVTTSTNYYRFFNDLLLAENLPNRNLSLFFVEAMVKRYGAVTSGSGSRFTPSFNFSITEKDLFESLNVLRRVIKSGTRQRRHCNERQRSRNSKR